MFYGARASGNPYTTLFYIIHSICLSVLGRLSPVPKMCLPARLLHVDDARASRNPPVAGCIYTTLLLHFSILYILSVYLFISLSVYISVWLYIYLVSVYLSIHLSIYLVSVCQSLYLFACLHLHQSVMILWIVVCWQCKTDLQDSPVLFWFVTRKLVQCSGKSSHFSVFGLPNQIRQRVYKPAMERVISRVEDTTYIPIHHHTIHHQI